MSDSNAPRAKKQKAKSQPSKPQFPALKEGEATKDFIVSDGYIVGDNNNDRKEGGDTINLSHGQAQYLLKLGAITLELADFGDTNADTDTAGEAKDGNKVEGAGDAGTGDLSKTPSL